MRRTLDNFHITMVEAVYLCTIKETVSNDMQSDLVDLLQKNAYMYIYLFGMAVISLASIILEI